MPHANQYDAVIVGAGPNGLAAAIRLAQRGLSVQVIEGCDTIGGGTRTAELTLPGYHHDVCSAIHPLSLVSPFLRTLPLEQYGLEWIQPPAAFAHPLENGQALTVERSIEDTAAQLGADGAAYRRLVTPFVNRWQDLVADSLGGIPLPPKHPFLLARFGLRALQSARGLARFNFRGELARAAFAGSAAHSMLSLDQPVTAGFGLIMFITAHAVGWPLARGGSQHITDAMAAYLRSLGGEIVTGRMITRMDELPASRAVLFDLTPRQMMRIIGGKETTAGANLTGNQQPKGGLLPASYRRRLQRFRYGMGVCKVDFALSAPIPWQNPAVARAATVHVGGTLEEIFTSEQASSDGEHAERPFVLLAQQSLFDPSRAPQDVATPRHTAWAYCHVPGGSTIDMTARIEAQIERFAPGFRDTILARHTYTADQMEAYNPNYIGGDINGGAQDLFQFFTRPLPSLSPYTTPLKGVYICSSSTPPGGGVHGMCGFHAANAAIKDVFEV